jgi:FAD/FMN-containing dehydrogenase
LKPSTERLAGWGNYQPTQCQTIRPHTLHEVEWDNVHPWIARGLGRSYGDSARNSLGWVIHQTRQNQIVSFDRQTGVMRAQAGISLRDILVTSLPAGYFLPVSPGTQFITLGGAVAADVHGKNHHADGSFGRFVDEITLRTPTGQRLTCSQSSDAELFHATQGGMGLTGAIEEILFRLLKIESDQIDVTAKRTASLDETLGALEETANKHRYSVSWIDGLASGSNLGRGWVLAGDHSTDRPKKPLTWNSKQTWSVPFFFPTGVLSRTTCRWFNDRVYRRGIVRAEQVGLEEFFYPLDRIGHWNRIYGKRGFIQYQAVFPRENAHRSLVRMMQMIIASGHPPFFAGIKSCGPAGTGPLSFLIPGMTIGIDFPYRPGLEELTAKLDRLVIEQGGRVYLAKDSLLSAEAFRAMYPRLPEFQMICDRVDPQHRIESDQSRRLAIRQPFERF